MKDPNLIKKYKKFYSLARDIVKDDEIFPELSDNQFEEFVSTKNWMGVPSFSVTKKEMTNSDKAHIGIDLKEDKIWLSLWFNGKKAVERFVNILKVVSENERKEFIDFIKNLDSKYKISLRYAEKFYAAPANWETMVEVRCKNLTEEDIINLLDKIKKTKDRRDSRQKLLKGTSKIATIALAVAEVETEINNKEKIEEALVKLTELTRIVHKIKSAGKIRRLTNKEIRGLNKKLENINKRRKDLDFFIKLGRATNNDKILLDQEEKEIVQRLNELNKED